MAECVVAGVDWAKDTHEVLVADGDGERLWAATVTHDEAGISRLCQTMVTLGVQRIAVERPDGLLVERLLDAGLTVLPIHPNKVAAARDRFRAAGGKSDRFDAFVLCELARTDSHRFSALVPDSDQTKALRALTRGREILVEQRVALCNQLRAELERFWPGAADIFSDLDSPISLAFLERYPSPTDARGLGEKRLAQFLARHHYCGRKHPAALLTRLRNAPTGRAAELEADARRGLVLALVTALKPIVEQIRLLTSEIAHAVRAHPDGEIFLSFFKRPDSVICAATLLAEIGDCRERYPTAEHLAADAGMAPVAVESGRKRVACFRRGCDHRLRDATSTLADATRHWHPWAHRNYADARARGHDHPRAIRTVGRAWTRVLWRCWQDRVPYDPDRHNALQRHLEISNPNAGG
ncbi:MAG TPA: IS110 family transposase [Solirubrobacteraceae bacterium]|jgi:transposase